MFTKDDLTRWKDTLGPRLHVAQTRESARAAKRAAVTLDQQMVGRLSRMDALQQQAIAQATHQRRQLEEQRVKAALARINTGEFGYCVQCNEPIARARLDYAPALSTCVSCVSG